MLATWYTNHFQHLHSISSYDRISPHIYNINQLVLETESAPMIIHTAHWQHVMLLLWLILESSHSHIFSFPPRDFVFHIFKDASVVFEMFWFHENKLGRETWKGRGRGWGRRDGRAWSVNPAVTFSVLSCAFVSFAFILLQDCSLFELWEKGLLSRLLLFCSFFGALWKK